MMADYGRRKTPPETEEEHQYIWDAADKANKSWKVAAPIHAAVTNWKGWAIIVAVFAAVNNGKIIQAVIDFMEKLQ